MKRTIRNRVGEFVRPCFVAILIAGLSTPATADEEGDGWFENWWGEPWHVNANIYGWLPDAPADITVLDETIELPESLGTILDDLNAMFMGEFEAHKGRVSLFVSPIYYDGTDKEHFTGPLGDQRRLKLKERVWLVDYGAGFDVATWNLGESVNSPTLTLTPYFGGRHMHDNLRIFVEPGALFAGVNFQTTISFDTPIVGAKGALKINDRWSLGLEGDTGVWDSSEVEETWQWMSVLAYHFKIKSRSAQLFLGYRKLKLELETTDVGVEVEIKGPLIGFGMEFGG
jgi:hypothetical protein